MEKKSKKKNLSSRIKIIEQPENILDQTDDFSSGCTPFKGAAIKAVDKENSKNKKATANATKKSCKKLKLSTISEAGKSTTRSGAAVSNSSQNSKNSKSSSETLSSQTSKRKNNVGDVVFDTKEEKICSFCASSVVAIDYKEHLSRCMKRNFSSDKVKDTCTERNILCQICQQDISYLSEPQRNTHVNNCIDKSLQTPKYSTTKLEIETVVCDDNDSNESTTAAQPNVTERCRICRENIGALSATERVAHSNKCADQRGEELHFEKTKAEAVEIAKNKVLDCPICGRALKSQQGRKLHLKKCCSTYSISNEMLAQRIKQQEEEHQVLLAAGEVKLDFEAASANVLKPKPKKSSVKKTSSRKDDGSSNVNSIGQPEKRSSLDNFDTQLALALSNSLHEQHNTSTAENTVLQSLRKADVTAKDVFSLLMSPKPKDQEVVRGKQKRKKKVQIDIEKLPLLIQSAEEAHTKLENKIANVLLSQGSDSSIVSTPNFRKSKVIQKYGIRDESDVDKTNGKFWSRTVMHGISQSIHRDVFYVASIMPPVNYCQIAAGSKLKHMSKIAGWNRTDSSSSNSDMNTTQQTLSQNAHNETSMEAPSQTAVTLAQLAQEHGTTIIHQLDQTRNETSLSQTEADQTRNETSLNHTAAFEEIPSGFVADNRENKLQDGEQKALDCFASMVNQQEFSDLVINVSGGEKIYAHKCILAARCHNILKHVADGQIDLSEYSYSSLLVFMKYIYTGRIQCEGRLCFEVKRVADLFEATELSIACKIQIEAEQLTEDIDNDERRESVTHRQAYHDKTLQNILKEAWGSDTDQDTDSDREDADHKSECSEDEKVKERGDDEDLDEVYTFMASQMSSKQVAKDVGNEEYIFSSDEDSNTNLHDSGDKMDCFSSNFKTPSRLLNTTVCESSVERFQNLTDKEVLEKINTCSNQQKSSLFELTRMFTENEEVLSAESSSLSSVGDNISISDNSDLESDIAEDSPQNTETCTVLEDKNQERCSEHGENPTVNIKKFKFKSLNTNVNLCKDGDKDDESKSGSTNKGTELKTVISANNYDCQEASSNSNDCQIVGGGKIEEEYVMINQTETTRKDFINSLIMTVDKNKGAGGNTSRTFQSSLNKSPPKYFCKDSDSSASSTPLKEDDLDSKLGEDEIIAMLDDDNKYLSFSASQSSGKKKRESNSVQKGMHNSQHSVNSSYSNKFRSSNTSVDRQSELDGSTAELFDSYSEDNISQAIKNADSFSKGSFCYSDPFASLHEKVDDLQHIQSDVSEPSSPVFNSQIPQNNSSDNKALDNFQNSGVQNLTSKFDLNCEKQSTVIKVCSDQNLSSVTDSHQKQKGAGLDDNYQNCETELSSVVSSRNLNCSISGKRKRNDSDSSENGIQDLLNRSHKLRKTLDTSTSNLERAHSRTNSTTNSIEDNNLDHSEIMGDIDANLFSGEIASSKSLTDSNVENVALNQIMDDMDQIEKSTEMISNEKKKCIDLTMTDEEVDYDALKSSPAVDNLTPEFDNQQGENTNVWDDFEDDGFDQHFMNAQTPVYSQSTSLVKAAISDTDQCQQEKATTSNKLDFDIKAVSSSSFVDPHTSLVEAANGTPRSSHKANRIDSSNPLNSPTEDNIRDNNCNSSNTIAVCRDADLFNERGNESIDVSMYDPPTDVSMNISIGFEEERQGRNQDDRTQQNKDTVFTPPAVMKKMKKKKNKQDLSKWKPPSPFTPAPTFSDMNTPQLQKKAKSYGIRAMPKKKMLTVLKNIYQETHAYETDPEYDIEEIDLFRKKNAPPPEIEETETSQTSKAKGKTKAVKGRSTVSKNNKKSSKLSGESSKAGSSKTLSVANGTSQVLASESSEESSLNDSFQDLPEESILESDTDTPKLSKRDVEFKRKQLWDYVTANDELQLKILHYEPIELDVFREQLKSKGIKNIGANVIAEFLDDKYIPFTNRNVNKVTYGRKKVRKKVTGKQ